MPQVCYQEQTGLLVTLHRFETYVFIKLRRMKYMNGYILQQSSIKQPNNSHKVRQLSLSTVFYELN